MKISLNWLKELIKISDDITPKEIGESLTLKTVEVEGIEKQGENLDGVVVGEILEIKKHPDADKLNIAQVDVGEDKSRQIVFGQMLEMKVGYKIPVALAPTVLPGGMEIKKSKLRGETSEGMLCFDQELGLLKEGISIHFFDETVKNGTPIKEALGLDDVVFDIDNKSLTNRPDLWGHAGIAREIYSIYNDQCSMINDKKINDLRKSEGVSEIKVDVQNQELCPRYMAVSMSGIKIGASPQWMQNRLLAVGMRPINNIVDVTNYVMLELGQPMHAFGKSKVKSQKSKVTITIRSARNGEMITTLDGEERELDSEMLVIADGEKAIAVAGVMGGENSEIDEKTTDIILESANFEKVNNRQTATKLGLRTEAVMRYEKGLDPNLTEQALVRCVELIQQMIPEAKISSEVVDIKTESKSVPPIEVSINYINKKIGADIPAKRIIEILESLGFGVKTDNFVSGNSNNVKEDCIMQISVPSWRATGDVSIKEDIVEEVARIYGFDNIVPTSPEVALTVPERNKERELIYKIKEILNGRGMVEASNYSFVSDEYFERMGFSHSNCVEIVNPISADSKFLRPNLISGLLKNAKDNLRFEKEFSMFEIGSVFRNIEGNIPAGISNFKSIRQTQDRFQISNNNDETKEKVKYLPWQEKFVTGIVVTDKSAVPFYEAKNVAEGLLQELGAEYDVTEDIVQQEWGHPYRIKNYELRIKNTKLTNAGGQNLGCIAEVSPVVVRKMGIKNARVAVFEFSLKTLLLGTTRCDKKYKKISKFPSILRDIAIIVDKKKLAKKIIQAISDEAGECLANVELFDYYEGGKLAESKKSLAFHLMFQSSEKTLSDQEIDKTFKKITNKLEKEFKAELRK